MSSLFNYLVFFYVDASFVLSRIRVLEKACIETIRSNIKAAKYFKLAGENFAQFLRAIIDKKAHDLHVKFVLQHLHKQVCHRDKLREAW